MTQYKNQSLIHRPGTEIATPGRRSSPVIAKMTKDILSHAKAQDVNAARFRIGEFLLREPDYRQILDWADHLGAEPEAVIQYLAHKLKGPGSN